MIKKSSQDRSLPLSKFRQELPEPDSGYIGFSDSKGYVSHIAIDSDAPFDYCVEALGVLVLNGTYTKQFPSIDRTAVPYHLRGLSREGEKRGIFIGNGPIRGAPYQKEFNVKVIDPPDDDGQRTLILKRRR